MKSCRVDFSDCNLKSEVSELFHVDAQEICLMLTLHDINRGLKDDIKHERFVTIRHICVLASCLKMGR